MILISPSPHRTYQIQKVFITYRSLWGFTTTGNLLLLPLSSSPNCQKTKKKTTERFFRWSSKQILYPTTYILSPAVDGTQYGWSIPCNDSHRFAILILNKFMVSIIIVINIIMFLFLSSPFLIIYKNSESGNRTHTDYGL